MGFFTVLIFSMLGTLGCNEGEFAFLTTTSTCSEDPVYGVSLDNTVTAVDLVLDYINSNSVFLHTINLTYGTKYTLDVSGTLH